MRTACDRLDELWYERWNIAAIAVEKHYDVTFRRSRTHACSARSPVTPRGIYNARSSFTRPLGGAIGAAVINDNHFDGYAGRETLANHLADGFLLVWRGDDNGRFAHRGKAFRTSR